MRVHVRGTVPFSPVLTLGTVAIPNAAWTTVVTYTVTAARVYYVTDIHIADNTTGAGVEFIYSLRVGGVNKVLGRVAAGTGALRSFITPVRIAAGVVVDIIIYQWSGGAKTCSGTINGFEEATSANLDWRG